MCTALGDQVAPSRDLIGYVPQLLRLSVGITHAFLQVIVNESDLTSPRVPRSRILRNRTSSSREVSVFHPLCRLTRSLYSNCPPRRSVPPRHVLSEEETAGERDDEPCLVKGLLCVAHCRPSLKQKF